MHDQKFQFYHTNNGPCPYRPVGVWENLSFTTEFLPGDVYEALLNQGFRRSGYSVYHPICETCQLCIPIRVKASDYAPSKSQRRTLKKNKDIRIEHQPLGFSVESFELYQNYQFHWHQTKEMPNEWEYRSFLIESPVTTEMIHYYLEDQLVGIGWVDRLPNLLSSVYFIFDPHYASRRLGVFSLIYELKYCLELGHEWLYLGYWVEDSPKMQYKADYQPAEVLINQKWIPIEEHQSILETT